jgi:hypothetical protein
MLVYTAFPNSKKENNTPAIFKRINYFKTLSSQMGLAESGINQ